MRSRAFVLGLPLALVACASLCACSGDDSATPLPSPDGGSDAATPDAGHDAGDAGTDASSTSDASPDAPGIDSGEDAGDADAGPVGTLLVPGAGLDMLGLTTDGWVVYWQNDEDAGATASLVAVSTSNGAPQTLSTNLDAHPFVQGASVVWFDAPAVPDGGSCGRGVAPLRAWTSAGGVRTIATAGSNLPVSLSPDGTKLAYFTDCTGSTVGVASADGTGTPATAARTVCVGQPQLLQLANNGTLLSWNQCPDGDQVFSGPSLASTVTIADDNAQLDPTGTWVFGTVAGTGAQLVRVADGTVVLTDPEGHDPYQTSGFDTSGSSFYYPTSSGALKKISLAAPTTSTTVVPTDCYGLFSLSPDGSAAICGVPQDGGPGLLHRVSTVTQVASPDFAPVTELYGFTRDSSALVWLSGPAAQVDGGAVLAQPSGGGTVSTLVPSALSMQILGGSEVAVWPNPPTSPVEVVDANGKVGTFSLPPGNPTFASSADGHLLAYDTGNGIYVVSLP